MQIQQAQQDVQRVFRGGSVGQVVSGLIWLLSAGLATWVSPQAGIITLAAGGALIFPITQLALKLLGGPAGLPNGHPFNGLAMQVAFIVPLSLPVIAGAALYRLDWFYPAFLVVVGAHYLPFITLYGMRAYAVLAALMLLVGVALGMYLPLGFTAGGWIGGALLVGFGLVIAFTRRGQPAAA